MNTHIIFDEGKNDDQEEEDNNGDTREGGIDINEAKELIKVQDRADKKRERERVKEKHTTKQLKSKVNHQLKQSSASVTLDQVPEQSTMPS